MAAERCTAGGGAYRQQLAADHRQGVGSIGAGDHRQGAAAAGSRSHRQGVAAAGSRSPPGRGSIGAARSPGRAWAASGRAITGRAWQQLAGDHRQGVVASGRAITGSRRPASGQPIHRQGVAASGRRDPLAGRGQQMAADHRQQGGQGLKAAKSSHAKDESPTGILSTHIRVAAEKIFFTPRRGVIWAEKRPFPARGRKPCYDFCVGRESPPAKQKLHSADHGAERISP